MEFEVADLEPSRSFPSLYLQELLFGVQKQYLSRHERQAFGRGRSFLFGGKASRADIGRPYGMSKQSGPQYMDLTLEHFLRLYNFKRVV